MCVCVSYVHMYTHTCVYVDTSVKMKQTLWKKSDLGLSKDPLPIRVYTYMNIYLFAKCSSYFLSETAVNLHHSLLVST